MSTKRVRKAGNKNKPREDYNAYMAKYQGVRSIRMKLWAIRYKGGSCIECGYDRYYGALDFHHRDPNEKEFSWTKMRNRNKNIMMAELDKCDLLCANCHREAHANHKIMDAVHDLVLKKKKHRTEIESRKGSICPVCHNMYDKNSKKQKFCSVSCASTRVKWPDNLPDMVAKSSKRAVAIALGVSDKAVAKRLKKHHGW